jgi:hypothetical protein
VKGTDCVHNIRCYLGVYLEGLRKTVHNRDQGSRSPNRDLEHGVTAQLSVIKIRI